MHLSPLGDQGVFAQFADESTALAFASAVRHARRPGVVDIVPAYSSVAVYFDLHRTTYAETATFLGQVDFSPRVDAGSSGISHVIPCCYERGPDLDRVAELTKLSRAEVIARHSGRDYVVYAIGFCPGFPYLGYLPDSLAGIPRLPTARVRVDAGSVGLTGRQTGIYPLERPGGWNLIGQTPFELVNLNDGYFPIRPGDRVRFEAIDVAEFDRRRGERLPGAARS